MPAGAPAILYSFRRCPYAIRARLALAAAGFRPGPDLEVREVSLRAKPPELLAASARGTVPVLVPAAGAAPKPTPLSAAGTVIDESLAIMRWALAQHDPEGWNLGWSAPQRQRIEALLHTNDGAFKHHLDRFKYAARHGATGLEERDRHRLEGLAILRRWDRALRSGGWLLGPRPSLADMGLLPFVRQFRLADPEGFDAEPGLESLQAWLRRFLGSHDLEAVMGVPWAGRRPWRSPSWIYHLALRQDWQAARAEGTYRISTRGHTLEQVGFVHLSRAHQVPATARRFYGDVPCGELLLLSIDPLRLKAAGLDVRLEAAPGSRELFPHLYGPLPLQSVLLAEAFLPEPPADAP
ncbi:MAG: DUF952 domain-containing protein [Cyanobium sp.]